MFLSSERAILESVAKNISCYSGKVLEKFTHFESPWLFTRGELGEGESLNLIIKKEDISKYFKSVKEKYHMINPNDIRSYSQTMFNQIS